jgi:T5orf172 domain
VVYFFRRETDGAIKIGYSGTPSIRLHALQSKNKCTLTPLAVMPGDMDRESCIHDLFAQERIPGKGEWFHPSERLMKYIDYVGNVSEVKLDYFSVVYKCNSHKRRYRNDAKSA